MTLRAKFTLGALVLIEVMLVCCLALTAALQHRSLRDKQRAAQGEALVRFAQVCADSVQERSDIILINYIRAMSASPEIRYMALTDTDNKVRVHSDLLRGDGSKLGKPWDLPARPEQTGTRAIDLSGKGLPVEDWSAPVFLEKRWIGDAHLGFDKDVLRREVRAEFAASVWRFAVVGLIMTVLAVFGAYYLSWHVNRPIQDLEEATRRMGRGDLDYRIQPATRDELGDLAESFNEMAGQLQKLQELREQTVSSITHDLQAPLSAILSYAHLLREQAAGRLQPDDTDCLDAIASGVKRLSFMTQDILDLAKLKAGKFVMRMAAADPREVVTEAARVMESTGRQLGVRIETEVEDGTPPMIADPSLMVRVLVNLLANALRFTPEGGMILIDAVSRDGRIQFKVMDSGVGIPAEHIGSLFTRFTQVPSDDPSRKAVGTGLGLAICKEIVAAHGGKIWAESKVGEGTTILFQIPVHRT